MARNRKHFSDDLFKRKVFHADVFNRMSLQNGAEAAGHILFLDAQFYSRRLLLDNFTILVDYNKFQSYGATSEVLDLEPLADKWTAFGFAVAEVDGHAVTELQENLAPKPFARGKPLAVICHTVKGRGIDFAENNPKWHHQSKIGPEGIKSLRDSLESA